jgi:PAS domain-containing protein/putative methionine-R-sulfoxide reductase with GAF domain
VASLLAELRRDHAQLRTLVASDPGLGDVADLIDRIGERMLVADEELRVQHEQLSENARQFDLLVAMHEELFEKASTAYLQTDRDGRVLRLNAAARRLVGRDLDGSPQQVFTIVQLVRPEDRHAVRAIASHLRARTGERVTGDGLKPIEVSVVRSDKTAVPVVVTARRSGGDSSTVLHWELRALTVPDQADHAVEAVRRIAMAAQSLATQETRALTLEQVVQQALTALPSADGVGVTLVRTRGRVETAIASGDLAAACDKLQYELGEGPCLDAVNTGSSVRVADMRGERRWPAFAGRVARLGVGSMLALPLVTPRGRAGALNVYARATAAFDEEDELVGQAYATLAAIALMHVDLETNLRTGLATRQEIGQAVGILMERHRISATTAFDLLVQASQQSHVKLRDVAAHVVETGEDPTSFT